SRQVQVLSSALLLLQQSHRRNCCPWGAGAHALDVQPAKIPRKKTSGHEAPEQRGRGVHLRRPDETVGKPPSGGGLVFRKRRHGSFPVIHDKERIRGKIPHLGIKVESRSCRHVSLLPLFRKGFQSRSRNHISRTRARG